MYVKVIALSCILLFVGCKRAPAPGPQELSRPEAAEVINKSKAFTTSIGGRSLHGNATSNSFSSWADVEPDTVLFREGLLALGAKGYLECTRVGRREENEGEVNPTQAGMVFILYWPPGVGCSPPGKAFDIGSETPGAIPLKPCRRKLVQVTKVSLEPGVKRTVGFTWRWDISSFPLDARTIMFGPTGEYPPRAAEVKFRLDGDGWHAEFGHEWEQ